MAALDFPSNPTNGQTYENFVYDTSITAWRNQGSPSGLAGAVTTLQNTTGLRNVIPTSIGISGGSATVSANGEVVFTGTSGITLNNIFSTAYRNYRVVIAGLIPATGAPTILGRFTDAAGSAFTSSLYYDGGVRVNLGTVSGVNNTTADRMELLGAADPGAYNTITMELRNPNTIAFTNWQNTGSGWASGNRETVLGGFVDATTQLYGLQIYAATGTQIQGSVTVYGYNK